MATNVDMGARLQAERQRLRLTQPALAEVGGVSKTTQVNYESGMRSPDADYLARVASQGLDVLYVVTGCRHEPDADAAHLQPIQRLQVTASAGPGVINDVQGEYLAEVLSVNRSWLQARRLNPSQLRAIEVRGTSMQPVLTDGDVVVVDLSDTQPRSGYVYVMRQGDELLVKYLQLQPGGLLRVASANAAFQPYDVDLSKVPEVQVLGRVVASMHDW